MRFNVKTIVFVYSYFLFIFLSDPPVTYNSISPFLLLLFLYLPSLRPGNFSHSHFPTSYFPTEYIPPNFSTNIFSPKISQSHQYCLSLVTLIIRVILVHLVQLVTLVNGQWSSRPIKGSDMPSALGLVKL